MSDCVSEWAGGWGGGAGGGGGGGDASLLCFSSMLFVFNYLSSCFIRCQCFSALVQNGSFCVGAFHY